MTELLALLRSAVRGVWRQRWWALVLAVTIGVIGTTFVMRLPTRFEANARVYVDTQSILQPLLSGLTVQPNVDQQLGMIGRTVLSRPNLERIMRMADIDLSASSTSQRDAALDRLGRDIKLQAVPGAVANLFTISYANERPETARKVVQAVLSMFVEANLGEKRRDAEQARRFLEEQIKTLEAELSDSENKLKEFKIRNMALMPSLAGDHVAKSNEIQARLTQARLELREAENARDELKRQLAGETPSFALAPESARNEARSVGGPALPTEVDVRLETLRKNLDGMLSRFTEEHPDVIGTRRIIKQLEQQRDDERKAAAARARAAAPSGAAPTQRIADNPVYQQLRISLAESEGQVASLRGRVSGLEGQLAQARSTAQAVPRVEAEYTQLTRDYEIHKRNYDQLMQRREAARISGSLDGQSGLAEFRVVDPPRVGAQPTSPNRPFLLLAVLAGSIAIGVAVAFVKDLARPVYHDLRALRAGTDLPLLGMVSVVLDRRAKFKRRAGALVFSGAAAAYVVGFFGFIAQLSARAVAM